MVPLIVHLIRGNMIHLTVGNVHCVARTKLNTIDGTQRSCSRTG